MTVTEMNAEAVVAADRAHIFASWAVQSMYRPLPVARGEGSWFWDFDGKRYLDFSSQAFFTNLGLQHPRLVAAIKDQAERLCTVAAHMANDTRNEAARLIAEHAPGDLNRVLFTNGGTEAVEHAVRLARQHTGRHKVLAMYRSFHGATTTSIHLTGDPRRWPNDTGAAGVVHFFGPYLYRSPFHASDEDEECARALEHLEQVIVMEGPPTIAAVVLEPVVGTAGLLVPPDGYLAGVRALCDRYGIVMIADEVMTGFGRTGRWFAVDHWDVTPDLITFAKGVNSGYVPLGGVIISERIAETFQQRPYPGGLTYSGHPLACASAVAAITTMEEEGVIDHAAMLGEQVLGPGLAEVAERHPCVGDVRGLGAFWALELVKDATTREPLVPYGDAGPAAKPTTELFMACRERGLWPFIFMNRVHIAPPCNTSVDDVRAGLEMLDEALCVTDAYCG